MAEPTSMKLGASKVLTMTGANVKSAAIGTANPAQPVGYITTRVATTGDIWCVVAVDPAAVANTDGSFFMPGGSCEYFDIPFGYKLGAIGASGYVSITPMTKD